MTASADTAGSGKGAPSLRRWGTSNALLAVAVLILIYQQVPLPYGLAIAKPWLQHALLVVGSIVAASLMRRGLHTARTLGVRLRRSLTGIKRVVVIHEKSSGS